MDIEMRLTRAAAVFAEELVAIVKAEIDRDSQDRRRVGRAGATRAPKAGRGTSTKSVRPRRRRRGVGDSEAALAAILGAIKKNPGLRSEELRKRLDLPRRTLIAGLARLRLAGRVKTKGKARGTTYRAT